jgi:hypothetical protein
LFHVMRHFKLTYLQKLISGEVAALEMLYMRTVTFGHEKS